VILKVIFIFVIVNNLSEKLQKFLFRILRKKGLGFEMLIS